MSENSGGDLLRDLGEEGSESSEVETGGELEREVKVLGLDVDVEEGVEDNVRVRCVRVNLEKVDVWRNGDEVKALTPEESEVLQKLREVVRSGEKVEVPSMKCVERRKVMTEVG